MREEISNTDFISGEFFQILSLKHGFSIHPSSELTAIVGYSVSGLSAFSSRNF